MEWHEQVVADRLRERWTGLAKVAVLSVAFMVGSFFFLQWATEATAAGELRRLVADRIALSSIEAVKADGTTRVPTSSPIGDEVEVTDREVRVAIGTLWDVEPAHLPAVMTFEVRALTPADDLVLLVRSTDRGGGVAVPRAWSCRRLLGGFTTVCDSTEYDADRAVARWTVVARR